MASVRRIAAQVGVSVATVSRALNNHPHVDEGTRRRVVEAAEKAGYVPASAGRRTSTTIGLVYPAEVVRADPHAVSRRQQARAATREVMAAG